MDNERFEMLLKQALSPEIRDTELPEIPAKGKEYRKMKRTGIMKAAAAAAMVCLVAGATAFAAGGQITALITDAGVSRYEDYEDMNKAFDKAGFEVNVPESFESGYKFAEAEVRKINGVDDDGNTLDSYRELAVYYENESGERLSYSAYPAVNEHTDPAELPAPVQVRTIGEQEAQYLLYHYKFVPADYELTEEDKKNAEAPDYEISYGSDKVEETDVAFLTWNAGDANCFFMDDGCSADPEDLFDMVEEILG